ncbi:hypothetical protein V5799_027388 [Amblyomma americanum]|uniref:Uncharacterized protein n=1 Tax=Amblyomma americanum TaxID=6943 RepID=A0AAQ4DFV5_AMBAM
MAVSFTLHRKQSQREPPVLRLSARAHEYCFSLYIIAGLWLRVNFFGCILCEHAFEEHLRNIGIKRRACEMLLYQKMPDCEASSRRCSPELLVILLLEHGADQHARAFQGKTSLDLAPSPAVIQALNFLSRTYTCSAVSSPGPARIT